MIGYCKYIKRVVLSEAECYYCIKMNLNKSIFYIGETCGYWTTEYTLDENENIFRYEGER